MRISLPLKFGKTGQGLMTTWYFLKIHHKRAIRTQQITREKRVIEVILLMKVS